MTHINSYHLISARRPDLIAATHLEPLTSCANSSPSEAEVCSMMRRLLYSLVRLCLLCPIQLALVRTNPKGTPPRLNGVPLGQQGVLK